MIPTDAEHRKAETWTLDDGSEVRLYRPSNGTEGEVFMGQFCARCACEPRSLEEHDGCPIIAATMALRDDDPEYPREWVERVSDGMRTCTAFIERPMGWDGVPTDPRAVQKAQAAYDALPRDPATGRPVIA